MNGKLYVNTEVIKSTKESTFKWLCLLLLISSTWISNAQCSVYTVFESFRGAAGISGATAASPLPITGYTQGCYTGCPSACVISDYWYGFGIADPNAPSSSYSGVHSMRFSGNNSAYLITPKITSANSATFTLSFYYKLVSSNAIAGTLKVEYSTSSGANSNPNGAIWNTVTGTGTPTSTTSSAWSQCLGTITAAQAPTGFYIKITRTNPTGGVMIIDDLSWTSSVNSENTAIVAPNPAMTCYTTSTVVLNSLDTSKTYTLYDNGGDSDSYNPSQDNKIQIVPPVGYKVVAKVNSVAVTADASCTDSDWVKIWYALPTSGLPDNWIQTGCATRPVPTNSLISAETASSASTINDGSIVIEFKSDASPVTATADTGCNITITFVPKDCLDVFGPNVTSITSSTASLSWFSNVVAGVGYDYYVSTSNVSPTINSTTDVTSSSNAVLQIGTVSSSNTYSAAITVALSGLSSNKTFYVWVRSNCSSSSHGSWIPITNSGGTFTTLSSCGSATPVPGTYTIDYQSNPSSNQSCTSVLNATFASYNSVTSGANNYIATNAVGSWYVLAPLALTAGFTYQVSIDFGSAAGGSSNFLVNYVQTAGPITTSALTVGGGYGAVNIINTSPSTTTLTTVNSTTFVASTTGTYYIGILLNSSANAGLFDNITVKQVCGNKTWNGTAWSPLGTLTSNDNLIFNGSYTSPGNGTTMLGCSCTVNSGTVVFGANDTLSLTNTVTVAGGSLTFNNNASLYQVTNLPNVGTINYKRDTTNMVVNDYTYWSSPVASFLLGGIAGSAYYGYDASLATPAWKSASSAIPMDVGKGYIVRTSTPGIYTATFAGTPNNGTYTTPVYGGSNQVNLIGNPYPSAISALSLINDPDNNYILGGTLYFWTHNTPLTAGSYSFSDYALYNIVGSVGTGTPSTPGANSNTPSGSIAAGQSFFVKGLINGPVSATFKNSMRLTTGNNQFFKSASANSIEPTIERHRVWLDISNTQGAYKQMLLGYVEGATASIDNKFDAEIFNVGNPIMIYSIVDNTKLTIDGRGLPFDQNDMVKLGYKATVDGIFTISTPNFDGLFTSQNIYLEDKLLNVIHDLKSSPYSFSTMSGVFEDRFVLRFTNNSLNTPKPIFDSNTVIIYTDDQGLNINSGAINMNNVKIYDIMGRLITQQESINDTKALFQKIAATKQFIIVQVTSVDGVVITKKVLY